MGRGGGPIRPGTTLPAAHQNQRRARRGHRWTRPCRPGVQASPGKEQPLDSSLGCLFYHLRVASPPLPSTPPTPRPDCLPRLALQALLCPFPRGLNLVGKQCILFRGFKGRAQLRIAPYKGLPPSQGMISTSSEKRGDLPLSCLRGWVHQFQQVRPGPGGGAGGHPQSGPHRIACGLPHPCTVSRGQETLNTFEKAWY